MYGAGAGAGLLPGRRTEAQRAPSALQDQERPGGLPRFSAGLLSGAIQTQRGIFLVQFKAYVMIQIRNPHKP